MIITDFYNRNKLPNSRIFYWAEGRGTFNNYCGQKVEIHWSTGHFVASLTGSISTSDLS